MVRWLITDMQTSIRELDSKHREIVTLLNIKFFI